MDKAFSIIIADDDTVYPFGLKTFLQLHNKKYRIRLGVNGQEVLGLLEREKADIIFMDYLMPVMDGIEATRKIRERYKGIKIIFVSVCTDWYIVSSILEAGVDGYIYKDGKKIEAMLAINNALAGTRYFSEQIMRVILENRTPESSSGRDDNKEELTLPEREALLDIIDGLSLKEAAAKHNRSEHTVHTHRGKVYSKTGEKTVIGLIRYARAKRIISVNSF